MKQKRMLFLKRIYSHFLQFQRILIHRYQLQKRVKKKIKNSPQFQSVKKDKDYLRESKQFLKQHFKGYSNVESHFYFSTLNGIKSKEYISSELFFTRIEPALNRYQLEKAYADKLSFDTLFNKSELPEIIFKIKDKEFFDAENNLIPLNSAIDSLLSKNEIVVFKPAIRSGGGKNIRIEPALNIGIYIKANLDNLTGSFVIQKNVEQHSELSAFHPDSLNTCRIMTARINSEIVVLSALFRMGQNNNRVDNGSSGGILCHINNKGEISDFGIDQANNKYYKHPNSGLSFRGFKIPYYQNALVFCFRNHKRFLHFTFISWDIAIQQNGKPIYIEFNLKTQAIKEHQILNGPLFGKHFQYFAEKYKEERNKQSEIFV